ncbi:response regulator [Aestuariibacter halophilus]|uniref:Response regulator n=1 Tax=Fluctibacter halophilus TaxID=226011 RepID=A0ABS8GCL6_9ALTE|nr:response regulator [Aestuariibacter halophilus]MCC2617565.1 response regulator [Aestuariibacter halophilus]
MIDIPAQKPLKQLSVLIIDGQALSHDVIKSALIELGVDQVKSAENAFFALRLCETNHFDMVIVAFDVKSDKDGFNLLEEMKIKGYVTKRTSVIFLSADTSTALVNCVVELQPTDFWVKPLDRLKVERRILHILQIKNKLHKLHYCIDKGEYSTAIYYAERQLQDPALAQYYPQINRLIGECLMHLFEFSEAEAFYKKLAESYDYAWVQTNIVRSLLKQDKTEEGMALADTLLERHDTRFTTYDALAEYYIDKEEYAKGYEVIKKATQLAPRNIERNRKSLTLARLNHDRMGQYQATQNMAKFAKNSIHDSPEFRLNVVRSAIDLAATLGEADANRLLARTDKDIERLEAEFGNAREMKDELSIIRARLCNVRSDKKQAEVIMKAHEDVRVTGSMEANLDKMKAFHELGMWEKSLEILDLLKDQIESDSFIGQVICEYLEQESKERRDIHYSPKELGDMASVHYKNKRYKPAFQLLKQAMQLSPANVNLAISQLKVLAILAEEVGLDEEQSTSMAECRELLRSQPLNPSQQTRYNEYIERIDKVKAA